LDGFGYKYPSSPFVNNFRDICKFELARALLRMVSYIFNLIIISYKKQVLILQKLITKTKIRSSS